MWSQAVASRAEVAGRVLGEGPVGVVDLHLRDGHRLGAAGAHQEVDAGAVEDAALERELLDGRRAVVEGAQRIGRRRATRPPARAGTSGSTIQSAIGVSRPQPGVAAGGATTDSGPRAIVHAAASTTSNMPIQPSSVNSDWWAWNM